MMARPSLPLHQIQAFDAAARHLSFTRAARELNVLGPAVGRQVAQLEADLGVILFLRTKPRLTLTDEGAQLARAVAAGFEALHQGLAELRDRSGQAALVVNAAMGFTSYYLLPRTGAFQSRHPDIALQIVTRDQNPDYDPATCDLLVTFGTAGLEGMVSRRVIPERLVAVCTPAVLGGRGPLSRDELAAERLLHLSAESHFDDWQRFFEGSGVTPPSPPRHDRFHSFMVHNRALQNGMGIGLSWRPFMDDQLESGALVLACSHECCTTRGYYCNITPRGVGKPGAETFMIWLCEADRVPSLDADRSPHHP